MDEIEQPVPSDAHRSGPSICLITRVELRHWWQLIAAYALYRRISQHRTEGLIRSSFAVELPRTFVILSLWRDQDAIAVFGNVHEHAHSVGWTFRNAKEVWSTEWSLRRKAPRRVRAGRQVAITRQETEALVVG